MQDTEAVADRPGLALSRAMDEVWSEIQKNHPDLPDCALFVNAGGHAMDTTKYHVLGHFGKERWKTQAGEVVGEVVVMAEHMAGGGEGVLETLLHEGAHAIAHVRGIQDVSQGGRYHNQAFAQIARELGLTVEKMGGNGLAKTGLAEGTAEAYGEPLKKLSAAVVQANAQRQQDDDRKKRAGGPLKYVCACTPKRSFRMSPSVFATGPVKCDACKEVFVEAPKPAKKP